MKSDLGDTPSSSYIPEGGWQSRAIQSPSIMSNKWNIMMSGTGSILGFAFCSMFG